MLSNCVVQNQFILYSRLVEIEGENIEYTGGNRVNKHHFLRVGGLREKGRDRETETPSDGLAGLMNGGERGATTNAIG